MEIVIKRDGKKYKYVQVGEEYSWVNDKNIMVPVVLQSELKVQALSEGIPLSSFNRAAKKPSHDSDDADEEVVDKKVKKTKSFKIKGIVNVFKLKGEIENENETKQE
jgi:hypothetical protein